MISIEWFENLECENCGQKKPHCAQVDVQGGESDAPVRVAKMMLCSDCVEDLKRRLS